MTRLLAAILLALAALLAPVRAAEPFDLLRFFEGESVSWGEVRTLLVFREAFEARFAGRREADGTLALDERFRFEGGTPLQRWRLRREGDVLTGTVETERRDGALAPPAPVRGTATAAGATLEYDGFAPGGGETRFRFRHEMTPLPDGTVSNRVTVRRFGLPLARSAVTFAKSEAALPPAPPAR